MSNLRVVEMLAIIVRLQCTCFASPYTPTLPVPVAGCAGAGGAGLCHSYPARWETNGGPPKGRGTDCGWLQELLLGASVAE